MVIGEQFNQPQQAQQQIATTHRLTASSSSTSSAAATTTTATQQLNHCRNSANNLPGQSNNNNNSGSNSSNSHNSNNNNNQSPNNGSCNNNNSGPNSNNNGSNINSSVGLVGGGTSAAAAKNQLEQLNTMREALFSQDGWGCQHVNQDTNWEVPSSPEPSNKDPTGGPPLWKPTINNGTDLWESNLRNGGQPTTQPVQKTPWGHTPSSNLGGTWGEDDDGADSSSVWTGSSSNPSGNVGVTGVGAPGVGAGGPSAGPQWGQTPVGVGTNNANAGASAGGISGVTAGGASNSAGVSVQGGGGAGGAGGTAGNGWGDPRELRSAPLGGPIDMRNVDPRDPLRANSANDPRDLRMLDPREPIRGDPRGISGRLNGTSEMWGQHHPIAHNQIPAISKMVGPGVGGGTNVSGAVVAGGGVAGIGPGVGGLNTAGGVAANVSAQWGAAQSVVGPKDITSMVGKQVTGWEEPSPPPQRRNIPNYDDGTSLWGQQSRVPGGGSHWKDISDPMNRSHLMRNAIGSQNAPNAGVVAGLGGSTGAGQGGGLGAPSGVGVTGNPNNQISGVGPQGRLTSAVGPGVGVGVGVGGQHKPDNAMWVHPNAGAGVGGRATASWGDEGNHNVGGTAGSNWVDDKSSASIVQIGANVGVNSWNDSSSSWNKSQNKIASGAAGWGATGSNVNADANDLSSDWNAHSGFVGKVPQKLGGVNVGVGGLNGDIIKQSKQYRVLVDNGFKKDDVERALINANMNIEEAAEMLRANALDSWRRHDDTLGSYADHTNPTGGGYPGRYPATGAQPTMSFPPNNILNNIGGSAVGTGSNNHNLATINAMQPLQVQKYLNQGPHNVASGPQSVNAAAVAFGQSANVAAAAANAASNSNNQPSAQQLRMLVQQIQLAVHSGYLSSQILNQPLAPATLMLLNQLLTNIKHLQGAQQSLARGNNANNLQINVAIAKYKQQIQSLQNQINAQQAMYIKQQQQQTLQQQQQQQNQHPAAHVSNTNAEYLRGQHDPISALQTNFSEINLNKSSSYQGAPNQQSRLNQWKLPVLEKDITSDSTDFSRAPGATKQSVSVTNATNMGPLGLQSDGPWSTGRNIGDGWPDPSNDNENKDWSVAQSTSATAYTDLVQEFEPGKPWKGSQIKSIEDDPSITPGSVARSPLSINPTPKEADIFANASKNSPTDLPPFSSSTWSFNPPSNNQTFSSWSDNPQQCATSELWATPINKSSRGPPPGLGTNKSSGVTIPVPNPSSVVNASNGWIVSGGGRNIVPSTNASWTGTNSSWNSNWLLLKNLTSQIDGSTLRTLCMQHGPLHNFHLYLNQGIALCKYATREEANKAQMTLNNCVLGNTTICAESPSENEVQSILQHLPQTTNTSGVATVGGNAGIVAGGNVGGAVGVVSGNGGNTNPSNGGGNGNNGGIVANNGSNNGGNVGSNGPGGNGGGNNGGNINPNSVVNGSNVGVNNPTNTVTVAAGGVGNNGGIVQGGNSSQSVGACNTNSNNGGTNNGGNNGGVGTGNAGNNVNAAANNTAAWRQTQNPQNQSRSTGREAETFDYLSKYVCSIVDD